MRWARRSLVEGKADSCRGRDRIDNLTLKPEEGKDKSLQIPVNTVSGSPIGNSFSSVLGSAKTDQVLMCPDRLLLDVSGSEEHQGGV